MTTTKTLLQTASGIAYDHVLLPDPANPGAEDKLAAEGANSPQVANWVKKLDTTRFKLAKITIQSVDKFGPVKVGFVKFIAALTDTQGNKLPSISVMRGGSVVIVTVLRCEGELYAAATVQPRMSTGSFEFVEVPAGMLDGSGDFAGVAAKELEEELGIKIKKEDLTDLTKLAGMPDGAYVSPGFTDETLHFFACTKDVSRDELTAMQGRATGALDEGEQITVKVIRFRDLVRIPDIKTMLAYHLYCDHIIGGKNL